MQQLDFPITDPHWRLPLLIMEWILAFICLELGIKFAIKYKTSRGEDKSAQEIGFAAFFLGFSLMWFFYVLSDYFAPDNSLSPFLIWPTGDCRMFILNLAYFSMFFGVFIWIFGMELNNRYFKRYLFTSLFLIIAVVYIYLFFYDMYLPKTWSAMYYPLFLIFLFVFLIDLVKKISVGRDKPMALLVLYLAGFLSLFMGFVLGLDMTTSAFGLVSRFIGAIMQLGAFVLIALLLLRLPPLSSLDWTKHVQNVFLVDKAGLCIFQKSYQEDSGQETLDQNLITSALSTVNSILQEMVEEGRDEGLSVIEKKENVTTIYSSKLINAVVISTTANKAIGYTLKNFAETVEAIYQRFLVDWDGDASYFKPIESLVDRIFSKQKRSRARYSRYIDHV